MINNKVQLIISLIVAVLSYIVGNVNLVNSIINPSWSNIIMTISIFIMATTWTIAVVLYIIDRGAQQ